MKQIIVFEMSRTVVAVLSKLGRLTGQSLILGLYDLQVHLNYLHHISASHSLLYSLFPLRIFTPADLNKVSLLQSVSYFLSDHTPQRSFFAIQHQ